MRNARIQQVEKTVDTLKTALTDYLSMAGGNGSLPRTEGTGIPTSGAALTGATEVAKGNAARLDTVLLATGKIEKPLALRMGTQSFTSTGTGNEVTWSQAALGFVMNAAEIEPTEVFRDLLFLFRESRADAQEARDQFNQKLEDDMRRQKVYSQEAKQHVQQGLKPPVEALPGVVIFFVRALEMLQGLCTRLEVAVPFMRPMAQHAAATLLADAASPLLTTLATTVGQPWLQVGQPSSFRSASSSLKATLRPAPKAGAV